MPETTYHITATSAITNHGTFKNSQLIFEKQEVKVGELLSSIFQDLGVKYPKFYKMDHLGKLGFLAAELLLTGNFQPGKYKPEEVGIVLSNTSSSLDADLKYFSSVGTIPSPALFVYTLPNIVIGEISIRHNLKGENAFFICERFDPGLLEKYVSNLFNNNNLQACICGWVEVIGEVYQAVLYLIEKEPAFDDDNQVVILNNENLLKIYQTYNG